MSGGSDVVSVRNLKRGGVALFAAEMLNVQTKKFENTTLAFDTMSDVDIVTEPFVDNTISLNEGLRVNGVNGATTTLSACGRATIRLKLWGEWKLVQLSCMVAEGATKTTLHGFGVQLLLSAWIGKQLGIKLGALSQLRTPVGLLPRLSQAVDAGAVKKFLQSGGVLDSGQQLQWRRMKTLRSISVDTEGQRDDTAAVLSGGSVADSSDRTHVTVPTDESATACLSEGVAKTFMERCQDNPFPDKKYSLDDIKIGVRLDESALAQWRDTRRRRGLPTLPGICSGGKLTTNEALRVYEMLSKHRNAFGMTVFPKQNKAPPVVVELLPGVKPSHTPPPLATPKSQKRMLYCYYQLMEKHQAIEPADQSPWCYRLHLTTKGAVDEQGIPEKVRPTDDARRLNAKVARVKVNVSDGMHELERASRVCYAAFSTDALSAYSGFVIHPNSRNFFTFYVPSGPGANDRWIKVRRKRLPFGYSNSPFVMLDYFQKMVATMSETTRDRLSAFYDDFALLSPEGDDVTAFEQLLVIMDDFLTACETFGVQLSPPKTSVGLKEFDFYGFRVRGDGSSTLSERQLEKIRGLQPPRSTAEVLSLQGLLTQFRKFCPDFSDLSSSITDLTKKGVRFDWGVQQDRAFQKIKQRLLDSCANYSPDWGYPLTLACDASDRAVAGHLYQEIGGKRYNIGFYSRKLTSTEKKLHIYFRESLAILYAVQQVKIIAASSPFKLRVLTDHHSLKYMMTTEKGALSAWHLAQLADVDFTIDYVKGEDNSSDFWSRYQLDDEDTLSAKGMLSAMVLLITNLGEQHRGDKVIWLSVPRKNELACRRYVQTWRRPKGVKSLYSGGVNNDDHLKAAWDFAILCPQPKVCLDVCATLLKLNRQFALLLPMDLLVHVPRDHADGSLAAEVVKELRSCSFLALPAANRIWVVRGATITNAVSLISAADVVATVLLTTESVQAMNLATLKIHLRRRGMATVGELEDLRRTVASED